MDSKGSRLQSAEVSGSCLYNILRNVVEKFDRESFGDLIGKKARGSYITINGYPLTTAKTTRIQAGHGNESARERLRLMDSVLRNNGDSDYGIIGQYHSHIYLPGERRLGFNSEDKFFFRREMKFLNIDESLQILAHVRFDKSSFQVKRGVTFIEYPSNYRVILGDGKLRYDVLFEAYKLTHSKLEKLKILKRRIKVKKLRR